MAAWHLSRCCGGGLCSKSSSSRVCGTQQSAVFLGLPVGSLVLSEGYNEPAARLWATSGFLWMRSLQ
uniref:Uncharacterized protein n=1 Tax=Hyaloperonospora arabidopsidis (strain Emoy2) TaxID=559515 RepID=M4B1S1_HYAAE